MRKMKKSVFAVFAVAALSGCASAPVADLKQSEAAPVAEHKVLKALPGYGNMGGYRYRRFAAVATAG